jgi:hypothetical protein
MSTGTAQDSGGRLGEPARANTFEANHHSLPRRDRGVDTRRVANQRPRPQRPIDQQSVGAVAGQSVLADERLERLALPPGVYRSKISSPGARTGQPSPHLRTVDEYELLQHSRCERSEPLGGGVWRSVPAQRARAVPLALPEGAAVAADRA